MDPTGNRKLAFFSWNRPSGLEVTRSDAILAFNLPIPLFGWGFRLAWHWEPARAPSTLKTTYLTLYEIWDRPGLIKVRM